MLFKTSGVLIQLLALTSQAVAQLPYNPVWLIASPDRSKVYQFAPQDSPTSFSYFDLSQKITASSTPTTILQRIPFDTSSKSIVPIADSSGVTVLVGSCEGSSQDAALWRFEFNNGGRTGLWNALEPGSVDTPLGANYLSAGFSFSGNGSNVDALLYYFGGMCPNGTPNQTNWTSQATYSNTMYSLSLGHNRSSYDVTVTGTRSPPIPEAGLSITPLSPVTTTSALGKTTQQQNFVLVGGHTQTAFINMSQVALFSLPEASWTFVSVNAPNKVSGELAIRDSTTVEPRSGHTAVLTEDGSKIIVFGGWVGTVTNPATPQLIVLQLGQGYGGSSNWQWSIPKQTDNPLADSEGVYGHGAIMLPGNVMMVSGGTNIGSSKRKRDLKGPKFYSLDTGTWMSTYQNATFAPSGLDSSQKAGLGAGIGLGLTAIIAILVVWWFYRRKMREKRAERERYLRELAFGSERHQSNSRVGSITNRKGEMSEWRSASWGSRQEQEIEHNGFSFPWSSSRTPSEKSCGNSTGGAERTGMEIPSPTRGLRKGLSLRGPATFGRNLFAPITGPGSVFRIDEVEEDSSVKSAAAKSPAESRLSDPFKDPQEPPPTSSAEERKREVQGWVEDWESAAVSMNVARSPSHTRTYSNLSQAHSSSESSGYRTGRESPEKSDRTGSNLSEKSQLSFQRSTGGISRQTSGRSVSAGYMLFASAAAAMGKLSGTNKETALERADSKRSLSLNTSVPRRMASSVQKPMSGENHLLLHDRSPTKSVHDDLPIKDYKNYSRTSSLTSQRKKTGIIGSMKRVLTGTSNVDVHAHVEHYEDKVEEQSNQRSDLEMSETATGPAFWRGKKGARDWNDDGQTVPSSSKRRSTIDAASSIDDYDSEDWDIETAVQKRVVQVMFTVPKEKLRVVNADSLSLLSRSDVDDAGDREADADVQHVNSEEEKGKGKGKGEVEGVFTVPGGSR